MTNLNRSVTIQTLVRPVCRCYSRLHLDLWTIKMLPLLAVIVAYLIGSIPFGYLIVRAKEGTDVRQSGSGGTGATNVSRRAGKIAGVVTLVFDAAKGMAAVLIANYLLTLVDIEVAIAAWWIAFAAIAAIVGHIFPIWLSFRGGKGVATAIGVFVTLAPWSIVFAGTIFFVIVLVTRYVSLGSMVAVLSVPAFILLQKLWLPEDAYRRASFTAAVVIAALVIFAHRGNIDRLRRGTESKFW